MRSKSDKSYFPIFPEVAAGTRDREDQPRPRVAYTFGVMLRHSRDGQPSYPSHETIADLARIGIATVRRDLAALEHSGWITAKAKSGLGTTVYEFAFSKLDGKKRPHYRFPVWALGKVTSWPQILVLSILFWRANFSRAARICIAAR
jgi:hypothetical protein